MSTDIIKRIANIRRDHPRQPGQSIQAWIDATWQRAIREEAPTPPKLHHNPRSRHNKEHHSPKGNHKK